MIKIVRTKGKKTECSKILLKVSYTCSILLTAIVIVGTFLSFDMTHVAALGAISWAETAVATGFYYNKAKAENKIKIAMSLAKKTGQDLDINTLVSNILN